MLATPELMIRVGRRKLDIYAQAICTKAGAHMLLDYPQQHPFAARSLTTTVIDIALIAARQLKSPVRLYWAATSPAEIGRYVSSCVCFSLSHHYLFAPYADAGRLRVTREVSMAESIKLAWRNMWRNWRRTSIALFAIVLGLILLLFLNGVIAGSDQAIFGNAVRLYGGNLQVHAPGFRAKANRLPLLPLADPDALVQAARAQPEVVAAVKRVQTGGLVSTRAGTYPVAITAIEPSLEQPLSIQAENIGNGRFLLDGEGDAILLGQGLADSLEVKVGDRVTLVGRGKLEQMRQRPMTVVGIYNLGMAEAEKGVVFITLPEAQSLYDLDNQSTEVAITLQSVGQEGAVLSALSAALPTYEVDSWATLRPEITETLKSKGAFTTVFGLVVLLIASIGILNLMLMAVFERTREMGVLAALGMKGRQIMWLFLLEGALIGAVGAVIGCALGAALVWGVGQIGLDFSFASSLGGFTALMGSRIYPTITIESALVRGIGVVIIAALASLYPAWQASRKEPAEALHHV